jgi:hypothetical protein
VLTNGVCELRSTGQGLAAQDCQVRVGRLVNSHLTAGQSFLMIGQTQVINHKAEMAMV